MIGESQRTSLTDVARLAGVSPSTASRALDAGRLHPVAEPTRTRVMRAAAQLGYRPNPLARGLRAKPTDTMAVLLPDLIAPYLVRMLQGVGAAAAEAGYLVINVTFSGDQRAELRYLEMLRSQRVAALLFAIGAPADERHREAICAEVEAIRAYGGAVVSLARWPGEWPTEMVDHRESARIAVRHLIELGHRRIAAIIGPQTFVPNADGLSGYLQTMLEAALEPLGQVSSGHEALAAANATGELLEREPEVTAIYAASDGMADGVMAELGRRGARVPDDVSVVRYSAIEGDPRRPALTTVQTYPAAFGAAGVRRALDQLLGRDRAPRVRIHPSELVPGETTRPLTLALR
ncbi:MAG: LacI family DNA-binding transcriptional regulator [Candidatus Dormibacteraeota bacterium]|nr:LacI family DNA-binding transcriptional regulator [Candidatus Dormibacteraeota bacterium]